MMEKLKLVTERNHYITNLQQFLTSSKQTLQDIVVNLDWSTEKTVFKEYEKNFTSCPLNSAHSLPVWKLEDHKKMCLWHQQGYEDNSVSLPPPSTSSSSSIVINKELQANIILEAAATNPHLKLAQSTKSLRLLVHNRSNIRERNVPQTADRFFTDFTTDERRVLYDYAVQKTKGALPELKEFSLPTEGEGRKEPMTREQMMAAERDAKRRRVRHRSTKVHTKSKKYSEVMREVINNQMQTYEDWLREQLGIVGNAEPSEPENLAKYEKEKEKKKDEDMVWLDWSFRDNPYNWWKHLIDKEKRRVKLGERVKCEENERQSENKESDLKRSGSRHCYSEYKDRRRKYDYDHHDRYRESKIFKSEKDSYYSERDRSKKYKDQSHNYKISKHEHKSYEVFEKERHRTENNYDSKEGYKVSKRKRDNNDQVNGSNNQREYYNKHKRQYDLEVYKTDNIVQETDKEHHYRKKLKPNEISNAKHASEEGGGSDTDTKSNLSLSSRQTETSRGKKSKKKHSHKHKSKKKKKKREHSSDKYNPLTSTDESSSD